MYFLLVAITVASSLSVSAQEVCSSERQRADDVFERVVAPDNRSESSLDELLVVSRAERLCIGDPDERSGTLLSRELWALTRLARHDEARILAEEFIPIIVPIAEPSDQAYIFNRLGAANFHLGRYSESLRAYWESTRLSPLSGRASAFTNLVTLLRRTHRIDEALAMLDSAAVYAPVSNDPSSMIPWVRSLELDVVALAVTRGHVIDTTRIRGLLNDGSMILEDAVDKHNEQAYVESISELASLHLFMGDTLAANRMIEGLDRPFTVERVYYNSLRARGAHAIRIGDREAALAYYRRAADGAYVMSINNRIDVLTTLGDLQAAEGSFAAAIHAYLGAESYAFEQAFQGIGSDLTSALYRQVKRAGRRAAGAYLMTDRPREALMTLDRVGARYLNVLRSSRPAADNHRAHDIDDELAEIRAEMQRLSGEDLIAARARESDLVAELDQLLPQLSHPPTLHIPALQRKLREQDQIMIVYSVDDAHLSTATHHRPHVIVVTPDHVEAQALDTSPAELADLILQVSPVFKTGGAGIQEKAFELRALSRLYDLLIAPVEASLAEGVRLVIVPDGPLYHLPFGMLVREYTDRFDYRRARYLLHDHSVSVELSPSLYLDPGGDPSRQASVTALARTRFDERSGSRASAQLPAARRELSSLRRRFAGVTTYRDAAATPQMLFNGLREASAVHVATHAMLDPASHLNHSILLSPDETRDDGTVYLFDLIRRDFGTPFVAITGCATAAGSIHSGDGMAGFQYAFRSANVGSVLSTHWLVDDDMMADITDTFYAGLADGQTKDEALRRAQIVFLEHADDDRASPFYWAAAVLYGDASPMQFTAAQPLARNIALAGAVLLALVAAGMVWLRPLVKRRIYTLNPA